MIPTPPMPRTTASTPAHAPAPAATRAGSHDHPGLPSSTPPLSSLSVTWRVPRSALGDRAPRGSARLVELTITITAPNASKPPIPPTPPNAASAAHALITAAETAGPATTIETRHAVPFEVIPDIRGEVHIESPGLLHATIAPAPGQGPGLPAPGGPGPHAWRLVYARTPVLAALGIPGGRAEVAGVRVG